MSEQTSLPLTRLVPAPPPEEENLKLLAAAVLDACSYLHLLEVDPSETATYRQTRLLIKRAVEAESIEAEVDILLDVDAFLTLRRLRARHEKTASRTVQDNQELDLRRVLHQAIEIWIDPALEVERMSEAVQQSLHKFLSDPVG
jgi:hypothetical protein